MSLPSFGLAIALAELEPVVAFKVPLKANGHQLLLNLLDENTHTICVRQKWLVVSVALFIFFLIDILYVCP